jgi:ubiquinone/menaquinone biosynthesis C-methylase UbiE
MLPRVLEPEVMDSPEEARDYDAMDHSQVNRVFVADFLPHFKNRGRILDVGTGTAQIPIELARSHPDVAIVAIDLAEHMLVLGHRNVNHAGLADRIQLQKVDAKALPFPSGSFDAVISNSIVHHIPEPAGVFAEMVRVVAAGGVLFIRDLLRPPDERTLWELVDLHAAGANENQRKMFADSLHAALTIEDVRAIIAALGFPSESVQQTTDRHWTWCARKLTPP